MAASSWRRLLPCSAWMPLALLWGLAAAPAFAQTATFQGLGDLPGGTFQSAAYAVSSDGSVIAGDSNWSSNHEAFRWTSGRGMVGLGDLSGGGFESVAVGISADGSVLIGSGTSALGPEAFRWTAGQGLVGIGFLPDSVASPESYGIATSDDGSVIVGYGKSSLGDEAYRWTNATGMVGLGDFAGGVFASAALGVSADGSVVVGYGTTAAGYQAFRWTASTGMIGLGNLPGGNYDSYANAVSADGSVVVGGALTGDGEAFRWSAATGMVALGDLPGGPDIGTAWGVSGDGSIIVGDSYTAVGRQAFVWTAAHGMQNLREILVQSFGLDLTGWYLGGAYAISADGRTIVGWGTNPSGFDEGWRARLPPRRIYVKQGAAGANDGTSWTNAYSNLHDAIAAAASNGGITEEIWVAAGIYKPDIGTGVTLGDRSASFQLVSGIAVYGYFAGTETSLSQRNLANPANETILSGDLGTHDDDWTNVESSLPASWNDNSYRVVRGQSITSATLDGFTITHGHANGATEEYQDGAGIKLDDAAVTIRNCILVQNYVAEFGGGVWASSSSSSSVRFEQSSFEQNFAGNFGGGLFKTGAVELVVQDCTFRNNSGGSAGGGASTVNGDPIFRRCLFENNLAGNDAGGLYTNPASTIADCTFRRNRTHGEGGGLALDGGTHTLVNCRLEGNQADQSGGALRAPDSGALQAANCVFVGNTAVQGGAILNRVHGGTGHTYTNCTFASNVATADGGGVYCTRSSPVNPTFANCIFWNNADAGGMDQSAQIHIDAGAPTVNYSLVQGGWSGSGGVGIINADPIFVHNPTNGGDGWGDNPGTPNIDEGANDDCGDLRLRPFSPATDAGRNNDVPSDTADLDGDSNTAEQTPLDLAGQPRFKESCQSNTGNGKPPLVDLGAYEHQVAPLNQPVIYVNDDASGANNGTSWNDAFVDLQDALCTAAVSGGAVDEIWVAGGTYKPGGPNGSRFASFHLVNGVKVIGGLAGNETILSGNDSFSSTYGVVGDVADAGCRAQARNAMTSESILSGDLIGNDDILQFPNTSSFQDNSYHVVDGSLTDNTAILDGFTISGGNSIGNPGGGDGARGGGMFNNLGSPTLCNLKFVHNSATHAGAIYNWTSSNPEITDCTFLENRVIGIPGNGGAIFNANNCSPRLKRCIFVRNSSDSAGGAISNQGGCSPLVVQCTFERNHSDVNGGAFANWGGCNPIIANCEFRGNTAGFGGAIFNQFHPTPSNLNLLNCVFVGNAALTNLARGGAIYTETGTNLFANCTFASNVSSGGGAAIMNGATPGPHLVNCIFWGNTINGSTGLVQALGSNLPADFNSYSIEYCDLEGWTGQVGGNIGSDPVFIQSPGPGPDQIWGTNNADGTTDDVYGNLRLVPSSLCVDSGKNSLVALDYADLDCDGDIAEPTPYDLDRLSRFFNQPVADCGQAPGTCGTAPIVDMGAYESGPTASDVTYVKSSATGLNDGSSWADAFTDLQTALTHVRNTGCAATQVWVADGTYKPAPPGGARAATFQLLNGVAIYGGFPATGNPTFNDRAPAAGLTILSGDIGNSPGNIADDCYHVVTATGVDTTAVLDGFTIKFGNAAQPLGGENVLLAGGGLVATSGGPLLRNCKFESSSGSCSPQLAAISASLVIDGDNAPTGVSIPGAGLGLSNSQVMFKKDLFVDNATLDAYRSTVSGTGDLRLNSTDSILHISALPVCQAAPIMAINGINNISPTPILHSAAPAYWNLSTTIADMTVSSDTKTWIIAPHEESGPATLVWTGNYLQTDLSSGGIAEAEFLGGGSLTMNGTIYEVNSSGAHVSPHTTLLLSATVDGFHLKEDANTANQTVFTVPPRITPTGGYLANNSDGMLLVGTQAMSVTLGLVSGPPVNLDSFSGLTSDLSVASLKLSFAPLHPAMPETVFSSDIKGLGQIVIDQGARLTLSGGAIIDLSGTEPVSGNCQASCPSSNPSSWGTVSVNGELLVQDSTVRNSNVNVNLANISSNTTIINNDLRLLQSSIGFGGQFFVEGSSTIQCNKITSEGDRYLDLDPDPNPLIPHPVICNNKFYVNIKQGQLGPEGELLELRAQDYDNGVGGGLSGHYQLAYSPGYSDTWTLEKLTLEHGTKLNLTNRQGFDFTPGSSIPEALYIKTLELGAGSLLNTGLQRIYYQTLVNNGGSFVDFPLLGFSLKVIAMNDQTEFDVRVQKRIRDDADTQPAMPPYKEGQIARITSDSDHSIPPGAGGVMDMRTKAPGGLAATSIAAKGAFARAGESEITIDFKYLFISDPTAEMTVYLSDTATTNPEDETPAHLVEVARLHPPSAGSPGSIGSTQFANFHGRFPKGGLNFTRGVYVELKLTGPTARVWIDDLDPVVCLWGQCGDFSGEGDPYPVTELDYLYLLSEYGSPANDASNCADTMNPDNYVDMSDLLSWSSMFHNPTALNLCDGPSGAAGGTSGAANVGSAAVLIAGKPAGGGGAILDTFTQNDALYQVDALTHAVGASTPAPVQNNGVRSGHGRLVSDSTGSLHQVHGALGLVRLSDGLVRVPARTFSSTPVSGSTLRVGVGLPSVAGAPIADAAFDPTNPAIVYVAPVVVTPSGGSPYHAAARLQLTTPGNYNVLAVYGSNPAASSTVSCTYCTDVVYQPDVSRMRELEVDALGNLFITSGQAVGNQNYVLIYPPGGGEIRVSISDAVQAPAALHVEGNKLYVSTSLDGADNTNTNIWRYTIQRSGNNATGLTLDTTIGVPNIRFITDIGANPADGSLWAVGYNASTCSRAECLAGTSCPGTCTYSNGAAIFSTPRLAIVSNPATSPSVNVSTLTGSDLALPLSVIFAGCGKKGDENGDGLVTTADIAQFVNLLINGTTDPTLRCKTDMNNDTLLDGRDIPLFKNSLLTP
jgi:probable HAF family extracellular repeat protein